MNKERDSARRQIMVVASLLALTLLIVYISLTNGEFDMTVSDVVKTLLRIDAAHEHDIVIFEFRLPRIVIAALVGFSLGIAGAVVQGITRNGLADPGILGIHAGSGAAIVLFIYAYQGQISGTGWSGVMIMPLFGWIGGVGAALLIFFMAWRRGRLDIPSLILAGIAIATGLGAASLYLSLRMNAKDFEMATVWLTGSIYNANWKYVATMLPWLVALLPIIMRKAYLLDLFQLGEDSVKSIGVSVSKERLILLLSSVGITAACVSVSGSIGFVGLLAPHLAKHLVGLRHRRALPVCGLLGMLLVVVSDFIAKTVFAPVELPVGIVISIIGVPYFIYLLWKARA